MIGPEAGVVALGGVEHVEAVAALRVPEAVEAGLHTVDWNGKDLRGKSVASGAYVALLIAPDGRSAQKLVLTK